jgi:hypothetical protein
MGIDIERRKHVRVPIAEPVYLENATGFTHDVSASGVFFWISGGSYNVGDQIGFSLEMSRPEGRVMVRCRGVIVRIEQYETRLGVAVTFTETETRLPYLPWVSEAANREPQKS